MRIEAFLDRLVESTLRSVLALGPDEPAAAALRPTTDEKLGDYQVNGAMGLAKRLGKPPREIAEPIADALQGHEAIAAAEVAGPGFINLRLDEQWVAAQLQSHLVDEARDGVPTVEKPETVVIDFSSPNIAKQMHVGHLRSTIIGDAISRLYSFVGHRVIRDNHIGDWGTQFGLLIVGMREWGDEDELQRKPIVELERVYKLASTRAKEDPAFAEQARAELAKLQSGDEDNTRLWTDFVAATRRELDAVYQRLGIEFDAWLGESAYQDALPGTVERLVETGLAREDAGALCVFWNEIEEAPKRLKKQKEPFIIRKKDGAYLYSTTDIATLLYRRVHFQADRCIYVVDVRQSLHFQQLFAIAELLGLTMTLEHVGFGTVLATDGKPLRTRDASGNVITLMSLLNESEDRARAVIQAEGLSVAAEDLNTVARAVGICAVKYADLRQNRLSDYQFDWDKMTSFRGNAGPYLQYAYARIQSIFRKGELDPSSLLDAALQLDTPAEQLLARRLLKFADVVFKSVETAQPHIVCEHLYELARSFSTFYQACPVLKAEPALRRSRLALAWLTARQLRRGLGLLGIDVVDRM